MTGLLLLITLLLNNFSMQEEENSYFEIKEEGMFLKKLSKSDKNFNANQDPFYAKFNTGTIWFFNSSLLFLKKNSSSEKEIKNKLQKLEELKIKDVSIDRPINNTDNLISFLKAIPTKNKVNNLDLYAEIAEILEEITDDIKETGEAGEIKIPYKKLITAFKDDFIIKTTPDLTEEDQIAFFDVIINFYHKITHLSEKIAEFCEDNQEKIDFHEIAVDGYFGLLHMMELCNKWSKKNNTEANKWTNKQTIFLLEETVRLLKKAYKLEKEEEAKMRFFDLAIALTVESIFEYRKKATLVEKQEESIFLKKTTRKTFEQIIENEIPKFRKCAHLYASLADRKETKEEFPDKIIWLYTKAAKLYKKEAREKRINDLDGEKGRALDERLSWVCSQAYNSKYFIDSTTAKKEQARIYELSKNMYEKLADLVSPAESIAYYKEAANVCKCIARIKDTQKEKNDWFIKQIELYEKAISAYNMIEDKKSHQELYNCIVVLREKAMQQKERFEKEAQEIEKRNAEKAKKLNTLT